MRQPASHSRRVKAGGSRAGKKEATGGGLKRRWPCGGGGTLEGLLRQAVDGGEKKGVGSRWETRHTSPHAVPEQIPEPHKLPDP